MSDEKFTVLDEDGNPVPMVLDEHGNPVPAPSGPPAVVLDTMGLPVIGDAAEQDEPTVVVPDSGPPADLPPPAGPPADATPVAPQPTPPAPPPAPEPEPEPFEPETDEPIDDSRPAQLLDPVTRLVRFLRDLVATTDSAGQDIARSQITLRLADLPDALHEHLRTDAAPGHVLLSIPAPGDDADDDHVEWHRLASRAARLTIEESDAFELVLGIGMGTGGTEKRVRRHPVLTVRLGANLDATSGAVHLLIDPDEVFAFEGIARANQQLAAMATDEERLDRIRDAAVDGVLGAGLLAAAAEEFDGRLEERPEWEGPWSIDADDPGPVPVAPVVFLRDRSQGRWVQWFDTMLDALDEPGAIPPLGLAELVAALEPHERAAWTGTVERAGRLDPLFPLPANHEQRQIIRRLAADRGVAVMGPPGTGKTHTIVNLLSALVADGKRVLVTSQKANALRILRDRLPDDIQPLCVSLTDVDRNGSKDLDTSVVTISDRFASHDADAATERAAKLRRELDSARAEVARLMEALAERQVAELADWGEPVPEYAGTKSAIALRLAEERDRCGWVRLDRSAGDEPPLTGDELTELIALRRTATPDRARRVDQQIPPVASITETAAVGDVIAAEAAAIERTGAEPNAVAEGFTAVDPGEIGFLKDLAAQAAGRLQALRLDTDPATWPEWVRRAVESGLGRRSSHLWNELAKLSRHLGDASTTVERMSGHVISVSDGRPLSEKALPHLDEFRKHLAKGGNPKGGLFKSAAVRNAELVLDGVLVDGHPVGSVEQVDALIATIRAQSLVTGLTARWRDAEVVIPDELSVSRQLAVLIDHQRTLEGALAFVDTCGQIETRMGAYGVRVELATLADWRSFVAALDVVDHHVARHQAARWLSSLADDLRNRALDPDTPPELAALADAAEARDLAAFDAARTTLLHAARDQADEQRMQELDARLGRAAPEVAKAIAVDAANPAWDDRVDHWADAWAWGRAEAWFRHQRVRTDTGRSADELDAALERERIAATKLSEVLAWNRCLDRMTAEQERALRAYKANIDDRGAGKGKWAGRYAAAARQAMASAAQAIPAWVMPLHEVLETLPQERDAFDVVIIDEASQLGIEAAMLLWLAPQVIVVGDDRQCAPSAVSRGELQPVFDRLDDHLPDLPQYLRLGFTPKSNLYSLLANRFGSVVRLREHFRCRPEIIAWSSAEFYADSPLIPLRQSTASTIEPLRTTKVDDAETEGSGSRLRNPVEAQAIVDQVAACIADPAYAGLSMGVIVLQGDGQVELIDALLTEAIPPGEFLDRHLRVGTPPDFQGDERDVIFLSLVVAEKRSAVTSRDMRRRYNVAASRAREQSWLFHSVDPFDLSPKDLRRAITLAHRDRTVPDVPEAPDEPGPLDGPVEELADLLRLAGYHVDEDTELGTLPADLIVHGADASALVQCDGDVRVSDVTDAMTDVREERRLAAIGWPVLHVPSSEVVFEPTEAANLLLDQLEEAGIRRRDG